ncbi:hypothetical protein VNO77_12705 [Canavalia gladiata]|uniref:DUF2283 domain-containing protein n=1 Tax=Canavalia gladiata TaxID=3824 RepID=A0AAN9LXN0_CANGL
MEIQYDREDEMCFIDLPRSANDNVHMDITTIRITTSLSEAIITYILQMDLDNSIDDEDIKRRVSERELDKKQR